MLVLNENKTKHAFFFHRPPEEDDITCKEKFLGLHLDSQLTWESHVDTVANKLARNVFVIRSLLPEVSICRYIDEIIRRSFSLK